MRKIVWLSAPVTLFVMGGGAGRKDANGRLQHGGRWVRSQDWPPPQAQATAWHLHADGLLATRPADRDAQLSYEFDPSNPVPTIGGSIASGAPLMDGGAFDQRETAAPLAARDDVLVFQTEPLGEDVEVIGPVVARLWVSTSALDTDFTIKLVDVHPPSADWPDGFAMNLTDGILRLRFRESFDAIQLAEPGRVYPIDIVAFPTANRFVAGHRIRVDVSSSNFPHFDVNPNTGAAAGVPSTPIVATNRVHVGPAHPSQLLLCVMPAEAGPAGR